MHYYKFNIGDYASHTNHLDPLEDIAYRRMIDWCYLHESPLPDDVTQIARLIRMRTHCEEIANVLHEFFERNEYGYEQKHVTREIEKYNEKSEKAKKSAEARWAARPVKTNANALRNESERNANHKPLTNNHKPLTNNQNKKAESGNPDLFVRFWESLPKDLGAKGSKAEALKEFKKLKLTSMDEVDLILSEINNHAERKRTIKGTGAFAPNFPHVCRMIKRKAWEDDIEALPGVLDLPVSKQQQVEAHNHAACDDFMNDFEKIIEGEVVNA